MNRVTCSLLLAAALAWAAGCGSSSTKSTGSGSDTTPVPVAGDGDKAKDKKGGKSDGGAPPPPPPLPPPPKGAIPEYYQLDVTKHAVPGRDVFGRVGGRPFGPKAAIEGTKLVFREAKGAEVEVALPGAGPFDGKQFVVAADQKENVPVVTVRRGKGDPVVHKSGYALTLTFGSRNADGLAAKVYLCLPDADKSYVVGMFDAPVK